MSDNGGTSPYRLVPPLSLVPVALGAVDLGNMQIGVAELAHEVGQVEVGGALDDVVALEPVDSDRGEVGPVAAGRQATEGAGLSTDASHAGDHHVTFGGLLLDAVIHVRESGPEGTDPFADALGSAEIELGPVEVGGEYLVSEFESVVGDDLLEPSQVWCRIFSS